MKFGVLGPLSVTDSVTPARRSVYSGNSGGTANSARTGAHDDLLPSPPKTRQLLALLLVHAGTQVSLDTCVQELWGDDSPRSAVQSLHTRVFHIRQALANLPSVGTAHAAKRMLETRHQGYLLHLPDGALDLYALDGHLAEARRAQAADDDLRLSAALRSALGLWRGRTLVDIEHGAHIAAQSTRLEGIRMTALEQCLDAELRLGLHHQLLSELGHLVSHHPVHENLHAQYMLALYRSGRTAHALEVYRGLSRHLAEELGIEPSHKLRSLQTAVLTDSTTLDVTPPENLRLSLDLAAAR
ncbi:AfsR/SARP family transcriptional regulator [Streptomyces sp. NPDC097640]|uniref:AfsR/SARP family transcriptional regulator n=1 Tax=Streptomyces sp. NPDC097640 TaxID=3157229 RepID=UPI003322DA2B